MALAVKYDFSSSTSSEISAPSSNEELQQQQQHGQLQARKKRKEKEELAKKEKKKKKAHTHYTKLVRYDGGRTPIMMAPWSPNWNMCAPLKISSQETPPSRDM